MKKVFEIINGNLMLRKEYRDRVNEFLRGNVPALGVRKFAAVSYLERLFRINGIVNPMPLAVVIVDSIVEFTKMNEQ